MGAVSLAELVRAVEKSIQDEPELFEEHSGYDIASAKASLSKCTNVEDVAKFLSSEKYVG